MHRESDKHGPMQDDELKHEMDDVLRGNQPTHAEAWRDPEPDDEEPAPRPGEPS